MPDPINTLDPATTALLVMDYQAGILDRLPADVAGPVVERAAAAVRTARAHGATIGFVRVAFTDDDFEAIPASSTMGSRVLAAGREAMHADSPATAHDERVAPEPGDVAVRKTRVGAFSTTDLDDQLTQRGVDTLVLAGIGTSGVVLSTVRDAHDRDYRLLVLADACADPRPDVHDALVRSVFPSQADVISTEDLGALFRPSVG